MISDLILEAEEMIRRENEAASERGGGLTQDELSDLYRGWADEILKGGKVVV